LLTHPVWYCLQAPTRVRFAPSSYQGITPAELTSDFQRLTEPPATREAHPNEVQSTGAAPFTVTERPHGRRHRPGE